MHLEKHVPLGELIYLDRERCIQCGRCVRFMSELAADPVLAFYQRGRTMQIITCSEPGFDSYFSGNTTDICPVGALTTADFRFRAHPWEMNSAASLCSHCPVGCNITFNVRREAKSGGKVAIKRAMPRQNEAVNEIWMCDKGRFAYHFAESQQRLDEPLIRYGDDLRPATWEEALTLVAGRLKTSGASLVTLAGGRMSNESLFNLNQLTAAQGGQSVLNSYMAGGDLTAQVGVGQGSNFSDMGKGSAILVAACDLEEEAPIWWLRVKQAAKRGATLIMANPRPTKLDRFATFNIRYTYGEETAAVQAFLPGGTEPLSAAAQAFAKAENAVILFGSEGLGLAGSQTLVNVCAGVLQVTGHTGKPNNGLIGVWPSANTQGAWDMGFQPVVDLAETLGKARCVLIAAADPAGDDPALAQAVDQAGFVVVQELFLTETARRADVVLPVLAYTEMEGSFTSGERRVQRFYPVTPPLAGTRSDYAIAAELGRRLGIEIEGRAASLVMASIAARVLDYRQVSFQKLSETAAQWPEVGRKDLYYGGTGYDNQQGLGVQLIPAVQYGEMVAMPFLAPVEPRLTRPESGGLKLAEGDLLAVPVARLYDHGLMVESSPLLYPRLVKPALYLHPQEAARLGLEQNQMVEFTIAGVGFVAPVLFDMGVPSGVALAPRSVGLPIHQPVVLTLSRQAA
jgi:NADH-quinone oxidoreductase subunit G